MYIKSKTTHVTWLKESTRLLCYILVHSKNIVIENPRMKIIFENRLHEMEYLMSIQLVPLTLTTSMKCHKLNLRLILVLVTVRLKKKWYLLKLRVIKLKGYDSLMDIYLVYPCKSYLDILILYHFMIGIALCGPTRRFSRLVLTDGFHAKVTPI